MRSILFVLLGAVLSLSATPLQLSSPGSGAASLNMSTFASGISFPVGMVTTAPGVLVVGSTVSSGQSGFQAYFGGTGQLLRFTDANHDGVADSPAGQVVFATLPGAVTDLKSAGNFLAAATTGNGGTNANVADVSILAPSGAGYASLGALHLTYPAPYYNINLATAPVSGQPGQYYLYFHVTAGTHEAATGPAVALSGLVNASLQGGSVYRVIVNTASPGSPVSGLTQIASGIRNSGGMTVDSAGRLVFTDNGYETGPVTTSADELNIIQAASLGGPVIDMGYPSNYINYATGLPVAGNGQAPAVAFLPTGGQERLGIAAVAESPLGFPADLAGGYFISFHGNFFQTGLLNTINPVVFYSSATDSYFDFLLPGQAGLGSIDTLTTSGEWLYMADLASGAAFSSPTGNIYALTAASAPEPGTWLVSAGLVAMALMRRMRG